MALQNVYRKKECLSHVPPNKYTEEKCSTDSNCESISCPEESKPICESRLGRRKKSRSRTDSKTQKNGRHWNRGISAEQSPGLSASVFSGGFSGISKSGPTNPPRFFRIAFSLFSISIPGFSNCFFHRCDPTLLPPKCLLVQTRASSDSTGIGLRR